MRVLVVTFPWKTHLFNLVPLAWALRTAGHEVRVASEPDLLGTITGAGLTAVSVGSGETNAERTRRAWRDGTLPPPGEAPPLGEPAPLFGLGPDRDRLSWEQVTRLFDTLVVPRAWLSNDTMMEDLVGFARQWQPELVIWNSVTFAGAMAAEAVGAVHARVLYCMDLYSRMREDYQFRAAQAPGREPVDGLTEWLGRWAGKFNIKWSEALVNGQHTIDQFPLPFRLEHGLSTLPLQYVPYNGPAVVPEWVAEPPDAPRVLMTFGLSVNDWPELHVLTTERMRDIFDAVADLPAEIVVTAPADFQRRLGAVPGNIRLVEYVPLPAILPSCSAVVHHGGTGSFGCSLRYGVPQLLISQALDAPLKFQLFDRTGAGAWIKPAEADGAKVRAGLDRLLGDPSVAEGARGLQQEVLSMPTPNELVRTLEELVAGRGHDAR